MESLKNEMRRAGGAAEARISMTFACARKSSWRLSNEMGKGRNTPKAFSQAGLPALQTFGAVVSTEMEHAKIVDISQHHPYNHKITVAPSGG